MVAPPSLVGFPAAERDRILRQAAALDTISIPPADEVYPDALIGAGQQHGPRDLRGGVFDSSGSIVTASLISRGRRRHPIVTQSHDLGPVSRSTDTVLFGGFLMPHFGHFQLETMCRLWPAGTEDWTVVFQSTRHQRELPRFAHRLLEWAGITRTLVTTASVRYAAVRVPAASFVIRSQAHRAYRELTSRIAAAALPAAPMRTDQPLYLSRTRLDRSANRVTIGERQLEEALAGAGVRIVHPQTLPLVDQIRVVNEHRIVIGMEGSAMHLLNYVPDPGTAIYLCGGRPNPNYLLADDLNGVAGTYIRCADTKPLMTLDSYKPNAFPLMLDPRLALAALHSLGITVGVARVASEPADARDEYAAAWVLAAAARAGYLHASADLDRLEAFVASARLTDREIVDSIATARRRIAGSPYALDTVVSAPPGAAPRH